MTILFHAQVILKCLGLASEQCRFDMEVFFTFLLPGSVVELKLPSFSDFEQTPGTFVSAWQGSFISNGKRWCLEQQVSLNS